MCALNLHSAHCQHLSGSNSGIWTTTVEADSIVGAFFVGVASILEFLRIFRLSSYDSLSRYVAHPSATSVFKVDFQSFAPMPVMSSFKEVWTGTLVKTAILSSLVTLLLFLHPALRRMCCFLRSSQWHSAYQEARLCCWKLLHPQKAQICLWRKPPEIVLAKYAYWRGQLQKPWGQTLHSLGSGLMPLCTNTSRDWLTELLAWLPTAHCVQQNVIHIFQMLLLYPPSHLPRCMMANYVRVVPVGVGEVVRVVRCRKYQCQRHQCSALSKNHSSTKFSLNMFLNFW